MTEDERRTQESIAYFERQEAPLKQAQQQIRDLEIKLHNMEAAAKRYKLQLETLRASVREAADKST